MEIYEYFVLLFSLFLGLTLFFYLGLNWLFTRRFILKRLSGSGKAIKLDKSFEAKMFIKKAITPKQGIQGAVEHLLSSAAIDLELLTLYKILGISCLWLMFLVWFLTQSLLLTLSILPLEPLLVYGVLKHLGRKRLKRITAQLPDVIDSFAMSLKSGYSVLQAVSLIAESKNEPIAHEFDLVLQDINLGKSYDEAFDGLILRNPLEDMEIMTTAILISKETGGNLAEVLDTVGETIRERERLDGQIKSLTAQGKLSGIILSLLPIAVMILLFFINPDYIKLLFTHPIGRAMLLFGVLSQGLGFLVIRRIVKIEG